MSNAVEFDNVSIVFGEKPAQALPLMDAGRERAEIQEQTELLEHHGDALLTDVAKGFRVRMSHVNHPAAVVHPHLPPLHGVEGIDRAQEC